MKYSALQEFTRLSADAFGAVLKQLGYVAGACYQFDHGRFVLLVQHDQLIPGGTSDWPAVLTSNLNYTSGNGEDIHGGFQKKGEAPTDGFDWPKGVNFYFPEHAFTEPKVMFALRNASGKRSRQSELDGGLEAIAARISSWIRRDVDRKRTNEESFSAHITALGTDLRSLIDHELRTPMAAVAGYIELLHALEGPDLIETYTECRDVLRTQTQSALEAMEKLSLALDHKGTLSPALTEVVAQDVVQEVCREMRDRILEFVAPVAGARTQINFHKETDVECLLAADPRLFRWAIWEVLKNAVIHSRGGKVEIKMYTVDRMLVVDVIDDGDGVSPGSEELIFLRFYQDPSTDVSRKGKRGLGLGLFLARHIAERHMGKLSLIRIKDRGGVFRFIWPLASSVQLNKGA